MPRYPVGRVEDVPPGSRKIVTVGGRSIGVFNVGGEFFALLNRCPHQGGELCRGTVAGIAVAEDPTKAVRLERPGEFLRCPWHGWEFDIRTGQSWFDPKRVRVRGYDVDIVPGSPEDAAAIGESDGGPSGRQPGPLVAEGYQVTTEDSVLVVDTDRRRAARTNKDADPG